MLEPTCTYPHALRRHQLSDQVIKTALSCGLCVRYVCLSVSDFNYWVASTQGAIITNLR